MAKILIVDDDHTLTNLLAFVLKKDGHDVASRADGVRISEDVRQEKPALILLDLSLPHRDGYEILQELKSAADLAAVPVIVMSAYEKPEYVDAAKNLGAVDFIIKPCKTSDVSAMVRRHLLPRN